jgi:hypothetical protein
MEKQVDIAAAGWVTNGSKRLLLFGLGFLSFVAQDLRWSN